MDPDPPSIDLEALFLEHRSGLSGAVRGVLGRQADVREVLQEAFLKAWKALSRGPEPTEPVGWIFVLTINLARSQRRSALRRGAPVNIDEVDEMRLKASGEAPLQAAESREAMGVAQEAIRELPDPQKEVFLLRVSGGLSFHQVAAALDIPVGTAKTRMRAALAALRLRLDSLSPMGFRAADQRGSR